MSHRGRPRRRPRSLGVAVVLAVVAVLGVLLGTGGTLAAFTDAAPVGSGDFTAGAVAVPVRPGTVQTPTTDTVTLSWTATQAGPSDGTATSYDVLRYANATGGSPTVACSSSALTCSDDSAPQTTVYYSLRARVGDNWVKEGPRVSYTPDVTAPNLTITTPVLSSCGTGVACGTASDTNAFTVEYTLRRARTPFLSATTVTCWNGSGYVASTGNGNCDTFFTATGTTTWVVPGTKTAAYPNAPFLGSQSFVLTVRATDVFGNVTTQTSSFSN